MRCAFPDRRSGCPSRAKCSGMMHAVHRARSIVLLCIVIATSAGVALAPASAQTRQKPHVVPPLTGTEMPACTLRSAGGAIAPTFVDPNTECGPPAADPVPDGQDIVVSIPPGPSFTVGDIPPTWW